jgi:hypothetical protein
MIVRLKLKFSIVATIACGTWLPKSLHELVLFPWLSEGAGTEIVHAQTSLSVELVGLQVRVRVIISTILVTAGLDSCRQLLTAGQ